VAAGGGRWSLNGVLEADAVGIRGYGARDHNRRAHLGPPLPG
jgi:hypothetical protein